MTGSGLSISVMWSGLICCVIAFRGKKSTDLASIRDTLPLTLPLTCSWAVIYLTLPILNAQTLPSSMLFSTMAVIAWIDTQRMCRRRRAHARRCLDSWHRSSVFVPVRFAPIVAAWALGLYLSSPRHREHFLHTLEQYMAILLRDGLIQEKWTPLIVVIDVFKDTKSHPLVYGWLVVIVHLPLHSQIPT